LLESQNQLHLLTGQLLNAEEGERRRISLELHDEMGQALTLLKFQIGAMAKKLGALKPEVKDECEALVLHIDEIIENVRRLSRDLSPAVLEELGLSGALAYLLEEFHEYHSSVNYTEDIDEIDESFSQQTQVFIYRIIQESLTNIFKHAQATEVAVKAKRQNGQVLFEVQDNGQGFAPDQVLLKDGAPKGLGLAAMQERVRMVGGEIQIWSQKGQGTRLSFSIPMEGADK
jgi:signal transduction histidine kinase